MAESPPSSCFIGFDEGRAPMLRRTSRTRSSPKTPTHPSNGYEVMEEDGLQQQPRSSLKMSPGSLHFGPPDSAQLEMRALLTNQSILGDYSDIEDVAITVSQGEEIYDVLAAPQEDRPASFNISDVKPRRRRKSIGDRASSKTARRRSLRLQGKALEPPTPEKMAPDNRAPEFRKAIAEDFTLLAMKEEDKVMYKRSSFMRRSIRIQEIAPDNNKANELSNATAEGFTALALKAKNKDVSKPSASRRRSLRIQEMTPANITCELSNATSEEVTALAMMDEANLVSKPSSSKRCRLCIHEKVLGGSPASVDVIAKKRQTKRRCSANEGDLLPSPKRINLGMNGVPMDCTKNGVTAERKNDDGGLSSSKEFNLQEKALPFESSASLEIGMTEKGHVTLAQALKKISLDVVFGPSSFDNVSKRKSARRRSRNRGRHAPGSVLALLDSGEKVFGGSGEENVLTRYEKKAKPRNRRDTFDLSKKRGLTSVAKRVDLEVFIDNRVVADEGANLDYVTPRAGSTEVDVNVIVSRISRTLNDAPKSIGKDEVVAASTEELLVVKKNLQTLTNVGIEKKMRQLFPGVMTQAYQYPCVSARIFAAMSIVYEDQANFAPLLPFLLSLVDAEIVSLKNKEENEVCFINKKVCFSGFDYSSTTTAIGAVVGQGGGDLRPSIEALESVLQQALKLSRPIHYLDIAIQCLQCMALCGDTSNACAKTMVGYFPSARFEKALRHYLDEMKDVKRYLLSQSTQVGDDHLGVRYRLNDFIGRSVRFHLRELLNTIPNSIVDFNVNDCEERWGRAVDDRSISSILNFSLEKIYELMTSQPKIFEFGIQSMPNYFVRDASTYVHSLSRDRLKNMDKSTYESLVMDITEARSFLFGARACKFVLQLLTAEGVEEHIDTMGGWESIETITGTFYKLSLHEGSENEHFVQLREIRDLIFMLEDVDGRLDETVEKCEFCIRKLRRKLNFNSKSSYIHNLKLHLAGEKGEYFPLVVTQ